MAQAYDTAASDAAPSSHASHEVTCSSMRARGVVMHDARRINAWLVRYKGPVGKRYAPNSFIDCSGDALSRPGPERASRSATMPAAMPLPLDDSASTASIRKSGDAWRTIPALMAKAEAAARIISREMGAIVRPAALADRMGVNYPARGSDWHRDQWPRAGRPDAGRDRRPPPGRQCLPFPAATVPGFENPNRRLPPQLGIRETARGRRRHCFGRGRARLCRVRDSIGSTAGHESMSAGDVILRFPADPRIARVNELPYLWNRMRPEGLENCWSPGAAPR